MWAMTDSTPNDEPLRLALTNPSSDNGLPHMRRLRVLTVAYAFEPNAGSEPGLGWNLSTALTKHHDVWVITRRNNRDVLERELELRPVVGLHVEYHDLPRWASWWKRGGRGVQLYSYLWQLTAIGLARKVARANDLEVAHHVTFAKYWAPSAAAFVDLPFLWGPVGGGDGIPSGLWKSLSCSARLTEVARHVAQFIATLDPLVRRTARQSTRAFGATERTSDRLRALGARQVTTVASVALTSEELGAYRQLRVPKGTSEMAVEFISVCRLEGWKGLHLSLRAFARADVPTATYTIVGDGPERRQLQSLTRALGIADRVQFTGKLPRADVIRRLASADVLIQASLHDSGGFVTLEAMACELPVIAVALGGPALQVTAETGMLVRAQSEQQVVGDMALAMQELEKDRVLRTSMGQAGHERLAARFTWKRHALTVAEALVDVYTQGRPRANAATVDDTGP